LYFSVSFWWDDRRDAGSVEIIAYVIRIVALVPDDNLRMWAGFGHNRGETLYIRNLAPTENNRDWKANAVGSQVDLRREAAARAAKTFVRTPLFAPAECW